MERTGDGLYEIVFIDGETFFRRETCDHFARIPGGGPDVLQPLLSAPGAALRATGELVPVPETTNEVPIEGFGRGNVEVDSSGRLARISGLTEAGEKFDLAFTDWGMQAQVAKPENVTGDQGPGGNPC